MKNQLILFKLLLLNFISSLSRKYFLRNNDRNQYLIVKKQYILVSRTERFNI